MSEARSMAVIDLQAVRHNASRLARAAGGAELMAVVKANGYGHGAVACAKAAIEGGASRLAVASVEEAEELRLGGLRAPVLIMSPLSGAGFARAQAAGCEVVVGDHAGVAGITAAATPDRPARVHVEVDTGMGRLGVAPSDALALADAAAARGAEVVGLMTHFATSDEREGPEAGFMREQLVRFRQLLPAFRDRFPAARVHAANSGATLRDPGAAFDMVRCGIALYGCSPFGGNPSTEELIPVMTWRSRLATVKPFTSRMSAGYGRTWRATRGTWVGIIPVGYADGFARALSNNAEVLVSGRRVPVVGTVSMDLIAVDLGPGATERGDEEVVLIGRQGDERITAEEVARWRGSISYEVTCGVSPRVARLYEG
jgi:alanine racemase